MPLIKSAKKRVRVSERKSEVNTKHRSGSKTAVRTATRAIAAERADSPALVQQAASRLDRAAQKGAIHPNKAARLKSRLVAKLKQLDAPATPSKNKTAKSPAKKTKTAAK